MQQAHFFLSFSSGMRMCSMSECLGEMTRACSTLISLDPLCSPCCPLPAPSFSLVTVMVGPWAGVSPASPRPEDCAIWLRVPAFTASTMSRAYSLSWPESRNGLSCLLGSVEPWKYNKLTQLNFHYSSYRHLSIYTPFRTT